MKTAAFAWAALAVFAFAEEAPAPLTVELRTGEKITVTKVSKVEPDGITVWTEAGPKKIPVAKLSKAELTRFSLTEEAAQAHSEAVAKQEAAYAAQEQSARPSSPSATPMAAKFITADQVKVAWVKRLPQPRSLDPNYSKIMESYRDFIGEIRAGKRDLDAQETAATYNKAKAIDIGNTELANTYEAELGRIAQAKSAAAELAAQEKQARRDRADFAILNSQLMSIDSSLRNIKNSVQSW